MELISVHSFRKSFGSKIIHKDITFQINTGEVLGLLGGSGTGKSVLLRSLIGLETPDSGEIRIFNQNISHIQNESEWVAIRKKVAYAFQGGALFDSVTVFENLAFPLREHENLSELDISKKVMDLLTEFNLQDAANKFPNQLSGGMQKRVGLARAIMLNPEIILYDEPTAGLDPKNTKKIEAMILHLKAKGIAGILVTHDMPVAFHVCDRIALLNNGIIEIISRPEEILDDQNHPILRFSEGRY